MTGMADSDELVRFRQAWKEEVKYRLAQTQVTNKKSEVIDKVDATLTNEQVKSVELSPRPAVGPSYTRAHHSGVSATSSKSLSSAVKVYRSAVQLEQNGDLDGALSFYRQAFRLDPHVDKAYHKEELQLASLKSHEVPHSRKKSLDADSVTGVVNGLEKLSVVAPSKREVSQDMLAKLIDTFPRDLRYEPEDEREDVPLNVLPDEVVVHVLQYLDPMTIERFALVCKKARLVSLDTGVWNTLVRSTYIPPQLLDASLIKEIAETYQWNFRRIFIEQPRVRLDGVYIAVCHYIRAGLSENAWVHLSHLVTYHRFLRFLPDGRVLSLLANEEVEPRTVIPMLRPGLVMQGFSIGQWNLRGTEVLITDLENTYGKPLKHTFQMTLALRSRPLGRWNKLEMISYDSVSREDGEVIPLVLKHERPFWFSKVRSYVQ